MVDTNINKRIATWLNEQGYPLEMLVAQSFHNSSFHVTQGSYYSDPETGINREIDVVASYHDGLINIVLVFECKSSQKKPCVLFTSERTALFGGLFNAYALMDDFTHKLFIKRYSDSIREDNVKLPWFYKTQRRAYGLTSAFNNGCDATYKAVMSAMKASIALLKNINDANLPCLHLIFPFVVVNNPLFETYLDENCELKVENTQEGYLSFYNTIPNYYGTDVHIVSSDYLDQIVKSGKILVDTIKADFQDHLKGLSDKEINSFSVDNKK